MQKKKHHYVPVTYLKGFTDLGGRIFACRKDEPENQLHLKPDGIAFERYYYSQPVPSGGQDNNTIEDLFGKTEAHWPGILERIRARQDLMSSYEHLATFLGLMRVRGPAARDVVETYLAAGVAQVGKQLKEQGKLPPAPESFPDIADHIEISIDPHQSLHAIPPQLQGFAELVDQLEYQVLHDATGIGVITSDNPVVYFDPALPSHRLIPYPRRLSTRSMELYFPLSANAVLRGRTVVGGARRPIAHVEVRSARVMRGINELVARFAYRLVFSSSSKHHALARKFSRQSPILRSGSYMIPGAHFLKEYDYEFGPRPKKVKWTKLPLDDAD